MHFEICKCKIFLTQGGAALDPLTPVKGFSPGPHQE